MGAAREADSAAEAWEAMIARALLPLDYVDDPLRRFARWERPEAGGEPAPGPREALPPTRAACVAIASDARAVATAEALGREVALRLAPWGVRAGPAVTWLVGASPLPPPLGGNGFAAIRGALETLAWAWARSPRVARYALRDRSSARRERLRALRLERDERWLGVRRGDEAHDASAPLAGLFRAMELWAFASGEFLHVSRAAARMHRLPEALVGARVGGLPSPFEPLAALYELGYGLGPVTAEGVHLAAVEPELE